MLISGRLILLASKSLVELRRCRTYWLIELIHLSTRPRWIASARQGLMKVELAQHLLVFFTWLLKRCTAYVRLCLLLLAGFLSDLPAVVLSHVMLEVSDILGETRRPWL